jgi:hypothetical protein
MAARFSCADTSTLAAPAPTAQHGFMHDHSEGDINPAMRVPLAAGYTDAGRRRCR